MYIKFNTDVGEEIVDLREVDGLIKERDALRIENRELKEKIDGKEDRISELEESVQKGYKYIIDLERKIVKSHDELDKKDHELSEMKDKNINLEKLNDKLKKKVQFLKNVEMDDLEQIERISELEKELDELNNINKALNKDIIKSFKYARDLAVYIRREHYKEDAAEWEVADDIHKVLLQIDNMVTGITRKKNLTKYMQVTN